MRVRFPGYIRAVLLLAAAGAVISSSCGDRGRPNLLVITIDTLRADRLGCYGSPGTRTPHLDRLAADGTLFPDCFTPVPATSPSHATILSGLYPQNHGVRDNGATLSAAVPLLSETLRGAGYATAAFVSGFPLEGRFGFDRGFDHFDDRLTDGFTTAEGRVRGTERIAEKTIDAFLRWLQDAKGPYFAWVHLFDPHAAYSAPRPFRRMYYAGSERDPENRSLENVEMPAYLMLAGVTDVRYPIALYEGEVTYTDHEIGRLLAALDRRGPEGPTLIVVVGDHGESLTEHGYYFGHSHFLYEPSMCVPLLFRWRGRIPAGRIVTEPVSLTDLAPTFLALLGVPESERMDGLSFMSLLQGGVGETRAVFLERPPLGTGGLFGVREGSWKYLRSDDGSEELYRLDEDPGEARNRTRSDPDEAARFRSLLLRWREGGGAQEAPVLDEETRERLRALGYAG